MLLRVGTQTVDTDSSVPGRNKMQLFSGFTPEPVLLPEIFSSHHTWTTTLKPVAIHFSIWSCSGNKLLSCSYSLVRIFCSNLLPIGGHLGIFEEDLRATEGSTGVQDCPASGGLESQRSLTDAHYTAESHGGLCSEDPLTGVDKVGVPEQETCLPVDQQEISYS